MSCFESPRPTVPHAPACSTPRTATCRRLRSCPSGRRRRSRASTRRAARARRPDRPRQHVPPPLPAGRGRDRRARRPAPLHGLGRPDPDRLGRLPGLLAARHAARRRRRRRHLPLGLRRRAGALHARARGGDPGASSARTSRCASTSARPQACRAPSWRRPSAGRRSGRRASATAPRAAGQLRLRDRAGRGSTRSSAAARSRRSRRSASTAIALGGLSVGEHARGDARGGRLGRAAAPRRRAALLHGHRRPGGHPRA